MGASQMPWRRQGLGLGLSREKGVEERGAGRLKGKWEGIVVILSGLLLGGKEPGLDLAHLSSGVRQGRR